jgi:hypothetical protein
MRSWQPSRRPRPSKKSSTVDEAFLFERSIDIETYDRHAEELREELTLARIDRHSGQLDELDVEGILAFDGNRFIGTGATAPAFNYLREIRTENEGVVAQIFTSWNPLSSWMGKIQDFQRAV